MRYEIELTRRAEDEVLALDAETYQRVARAIDSLGEMPRPPGVRKLKGYANEWRVRVGRFRILYSINDSERKIIIFRVTDRKDVYRN